MRQVYVESASDALTHVKAVPLRQNYLHGGISGKELNDDEEESSGLMSKRRLK